MASSLNRVVLIGRLGQDAETRYLENNVSVTKFSVATNDRYKDKDDKWQDGPTEWHNVVAWRYLSERTKDLKKGTLVYVEGKINYRTYEDSNGQSRKVTDILAYDVRELVSERRSDNSFPSSEDDPFRSSAPQTTSTPPPPPSPKEEPTADDDLPF